jgi:integrase
MRHGKHVRVRLKGINTVRRYRKDGSCAVYYYHRATGRQLEGAPGSPQFIASFGVAEKSHSERAKGTITAAIRRFEGTAEQPNPIFDAFEESTKVEYRRKFKVIDRKWGTAPHAAFNDKEFRRDVLDWRDKIAARAPREADNLVSALARVGSWLFDRGELDRNILDDFPRVYHADRSDKIWLPAHVQAFTKAASDEMFLALMLAMHTGQRQGDLRRLPWSAFDGERITLRQSKGKREVSIRCTKALRAVLERAPRRGPLVLTTPAGRAWKKRWFNECWNEAFRASKINEDLHFHDLRGTAVTMLAEAGCTVPEIAAITGHSLTHVTRILETYLSRTRTLADAAILKFDRRLRRLEKSGK